MSWMVAAMVAVAAIAGTLVGFAAGCWVMFDVIRRRMH